MIPPNIAIVKALKAGIELLRATGGAGKTLWDSYFKSEREHVSSDDVDRWYAHFLAHPPRIERSYPRRNVTAWPFIAVPIIADADDRRFIGNAAGRDEDDEHFGVIEEAKVGVYIYSENLDELDYLHLICKKVIRGATVYLDGLGIAMVIYENGADVQPGDLLPETVFLRGQTWSMKGLESSVVNLGAAVANVYVHSEKATFTVGDTTDTGGVGA